MFAREFVEDEADGEGLDVAGIGGGGRGGFAGLRAGLGAGNVFDVGERKKVAVFGGIKEVGGADADGFVGVEALGGELGDAIGGGGRGGDDPVAAEDHNSAGRDVRGEHCLKDGEGDAGLVAKRRDPAVAGIKAGIVADRREEGRVLAVVAADGITESAIRGGAAEALDPAVFVGWHGLRGELAADPGVFFKDDGRAVRSRDGERGGDAADAAAGDEDVTRESGRGHTGAK